MVSTFGKKTTGKKYYPKYRTYKPRTYPKGKMVEWKSIDAAGNIAVNTTGNVVLLNGTSMGTDLTNRVGRRITVRSLQLAATMSVTSSTGTDQYHRIMLVKDNDPRGSLPAITDIISAIGINNLRNLDNRTRFNILFDRKIQLNASAESGSSKFIKFYKKLYMDEEFNSTNNGTITDITKGALYLIVLGDQVAGAQAGNCNYQTRVRFTD